MSYWRPTKRYSFVSVDTPRELCSPRHENFPKGCRNQGLTLTTRLRQADAKNRENQGAPPLLFRVCPREPETPQPGAVFRAHRAPAGRRAVARGRHGPGSMSPRSPFSASPIDTTCNNQVHTHSVINPSSLSWHFIVPDGTSCSPFSRREPCRSDAGPAHRRAQRCHRERHPHYRGPQLSLRVRKSLTYHEFVQKSESRRRYWARSASG